MCKACSGTLERVRAGISFLWLLQQSSKYTNIQTYFLTVPEAGINRAGSFCGSAEKPAPQLPVDPDSLLTIFGILWLVEASPWPRLHLPMACFLCMPVPQVSFHIDLGQPLVPHVIPFTSVKISCFHPSAIFISTYLLYIMISYTVTFSNTF